METKTTVRYVLKVFVDGKHVGEYQYDRDLSEDKARQDVKVKRDAHPNQAFKLIKTTVTEEEITDV
jgi:hypothetical protein